MKPISGSVVVISQKSSALLQTKEEAKALLRTIAQKRSQQEQGEMQVCLFIIIHHMLVYCELLSCCSILE
jgi:hypothetical protein